MRSCRRATSWGGARRSASRYRRCRVVKSTEPARRAIVAAGGFVTLCFVQQPDTQWSDGAKGGAGAARQRLAMLIADNGKAGREAAQFSDCGCQQGIVIRILPREEIGEPDGLIGAVGGADGDRLVALAGGKDRECRVVQQFGKEHRLVGRRAQGSPCRLPGG